MKKIVIIIPALNEAATIQKIIQSIPKKINHYQVKIIVIDDGSSDNTAQLSKQSGAKVISHWTQKGLGKTFQTGVMAALKEKTDIMVNIDADNQFFVEDIKKIIKPIINQQADFTTGNRFTKKNKLYCKPKNMPLAKYYGNQLMSLAINLLTRQQFRDVSCGFRAYNKETLLHLNLSGKFTYTQETFIDLVMKDLRIVSVPIRVKYFPNRKSKIAYNLLKYGFNTLLIILRTFRDYQPLTFFFYISLPFFISSLLTGAFMLTYYLTTGSFTPYKIIGFLFIYLSTITLALWCIAVLADMFVRIRNNQELLLYFEKRRLFLK